MASRRLAPPRAPYRHQEPALLCVDIRSVAEGSRASTLTAQGAQLAHSTIPVPRKLWRGSTLLVAGSECSSMEAVHVSAATALASSKHTREANDGVLRMVLPSVLLLLELDLLLDLLRLALLLDLLLDLLRLALLLDPLLEGCPRRPLPGK